MLKNINFETEKYSLNQRIRELEYNLKLLQNALPQLYQMGKITSEQGTQQIELIKQQINTLKTQILEYEQHNNPH